MKTGYEKMVTRRKLISYDAGGRPEEVPTPSQRIPGGPIRAIAKSLDILANGPGPELIPSLLAHTDGPSIAPNLRMYVRLPGKPKIRIKEAFEDENGCITEEFMAAYRLAVSGKTPNAPKSKKKVERSFNWLVDRYYKSSEWSSFAPETQKLKRPFSTGSLRRPVTYHLSFIGRKT